MSGIVGNNTNRGSGIVKSAAVGADSIDGSHIADDVIDSEHLVAASVDNEHLADNAVGLAEMAGGTDGQIISYDASGDPVALGPGNDGQVLTSAGAGAPPVFEDAAGGGALTYIASVTASSSGTVDFLTSFSSTYDDYVVRCNNIVAGTDSSVLYCRVALSGSADATSSAYVYAMFGLSEAAGDENAASTGQTNFRFGISGLGNASGESGSGEIWLMGVNNTALNKHVHWTWTHLNEGNVLEYGTGGGTYMNSTVAWTGCSFLFSAGNVASGDFHLYGVAKS
jgi:hypothetical protein